MKKVYKKKVKNKGGFYETVSKRPRRLYSFIIHLLTYETGSKRPRRLHLLLILLGLELIHFLTRVPNLCSQPIFGDEAIYIRWAQIIAENPKEWLFVPNTDGKQPLFMWINAFLTMPFFNDPCFAARLVSVIASSFSLLALFLLGLWLFSFPVALISSILYLFSPYILLYGRMGVVDTLLGMFAIFALLFTHLLIEKKKLRVIFALLLGVCIGSAFLTKSPGLFLVFPVSLSVFFLRKKKDYSIFFYTFFAFLIAGGLVGENGQDI